MATAALSAARLRKSLCSSGNRQLAGRRREGKYEKSTSIVRRDGDGLDGMVDPDANAAEGGVTLGYYDDAFMPM